MCECQQERVKPLIFVIDDDEIVRERLIIALTCRGTYSVTTFTNAFRALGKVLFDHPDLIILDIQMMGMSGCEFLETLREMNMGHIPVLVVTSDVRISTLNSLSALGLEEILYKPVQLKVLIQTIEHLLSKRREESRA